MKNNMLKFVLVFSLLLNLSMLASAGYTYYKQSRYQALPMGHGFRQPGMLVPAHLFEELSLKPEQLKAMQEKAMGFHTDLNRKGQEIDRMRASLVALIQDDKPDSKAIDATVAEINRLQLEVQKTAVSHMLEFKGMLDKDQQKRFLGLIEGAMTTKAGLQCP
jgi:Spy/CpxP family protein refolding chaperone